MASMNYFIYIILKSDIFYDLSEDIIFSSVLCKPLMNIVEKIHSMLNKAKRGRDT
jgi:hypothetical protein